MKIAFIIPKVVNKGPIIVVRDIINSIYKEVELIDVYYFDEGAEINFKVKSYRISFWRPINFDKYDIIHSHMLRPDIYIWKYRHLIKRAHCISTVHQDIGKNLTYTYNRATGFIFEKLWLRALKCQDVVVTLTETMRNQYKDRLAQCNLITIYNGRDISAKMLKDGADDKDDQLLGELRKKLKIIGVCANLDGRKGINQIIKALKYLKGYCLVIIGEGKEKMRLITLAKEFNVENLCYFIGYRINAFRYFKYFDIYCMSSYSEGFPLVLLEAAQIKVPIICSNLILFNELFTNDEVVFFELDNIKSLLKAIDEVTENSQKRIQNAYLKVKIQYSIESMASKYMHLYKGLADERL